MADTFLRNIDLMTHATVRRSSGSKPLMNSVNGGISAVIWDDVTLVPFTPTRLRDKSIPRCVSLAVQVSYLFTAVPAGAVWPVVTIRDGSVATNSPLSILNGFEMLPGSMISLESDEKEIIEQTFIDPTQFWVFLNSVLQVRLHIMYGVMK